MTSGVRIKSSHMKKREQSASQHDSLKHSSSISAFIVSTVNPATFPSLSTALTYPTVSHVNAFSIKKQPHLS